MSNREDLTALAAENGWALNTRTDTFEEARVTAVGDAGTVKMLFDANGKLVSSYRYDLRRRQYRTERIGVTKGWLDAPKKASNP